MSRIRMTVGERFGRLMVAELIESRPRSRTARVVCDCGRERIVERSNLRSGDTRSCGCLRNEVAASRAEMAGLHRLSHGHTTAGRHSSEYAAWAHAKDRVTNERHPRWKDWGGRGITMCQEWLADFTAFLIHIGPRPGPEFSLDRIDNAGNYEPGNVRWATRSQQQRNQRPRRTA